MKLEVRIERLGAQGDGVAQGPAGPLLGLTHFPGELVKVVARLAWTEPNLLPLLSQALTASQRCTAISALAAAVPSSA